VVATSIPAGIVTVSPRLLHVNTNSLAYIFPVAPWCHCAASSYNCMLAIFNRLPSFFHLTSNSCMIVALALQVQKIVIIKCCCCGDVNSVPKIFDHGTKLYCQHYRLPYCLHLHCEVRTVSSCGILALQPISAHHHHLKMGYISLDSCAEHLLIKLPRRVSAANCHLQGVTRSL
jgi:hypothetical protein